LQIRVMAAASNAPNLASAVNIDAFNLGNAIGAVLGGAVIASGLDIQPSHWQRRRSGRRSGPVAAHEAQQPASRSEGEQTRLVGPAPTTGIGLIAESSHSAFQAIIALA